MKLLIGLLLLWLITVGCMPATHDHMISTQNKAKVENQIGEKISLNVCAKYMYISTEKSARLKIEIPEDPISEVFLLTSSVHKITYDSTGGFDYEDSGNINYINFDLDYSSFDRVKLCVKGMANIIIKKTDVCPYQSVEQFTPAFCHD